ncbi:MAG: hypothetical protein HY321_09380 [Armatimonadetes bacterium]|nr:hypothetical protein [Armatimonadota bacterium]
MTVTIDLPPGAQARLERTARARGVDVAGCARQIIEAGLATGPHQALADLVQAWREEDMMADRAERNAREAEWQELKSNLNANRAAAGERVLFP